MLRRLAVLTVLLALTAAPALAVQATTQVTLNMPSLVILYYSSSVTFDVADTDMSGVLLTGANANDEGAVVIAGLGGDAGVTGANYSAGAVTTTVDNFWGVRSIAPGGQNTQVTVSFSPASLSNGTDNITISNALTDLAGVGGFAASSVVFPPTGMALQLGDVRFDLDGRGAGRRGATRRRRDLRPLRALPHRRASPGRYRLRVESDLASERTVELGIDFLFEQDLVVRSDPSGRDSRQRASGR